LGKAEWTATRDYAYGRLMIARFILALIISLGAGAQALACTCAYSYSTGEIVENGAIVVLATPVGDYSERMYADGSVYPTRLRILKTYSGDTSTFENIDSASNSSCGVRFPQKEPSLIVASRGNSGSLRTGFCSDGGYTKTEWLEYFETGKNAVSWNSCVMEIKNAYESGGIFRLKHEECSSYVEEYDVRQAEYEARKSGRPTLTEQQSCFQKIGENYGIKMITGVQVELEDAALCEKYIPEYDKAHPTHRAGADARSSRQAQPNVKTDAEAVPEKKAWWKFWK